MIFQNILQAESDLVLEDLLTRYNHFKQIDKDKLKTLCQESFRLWTKAEQVPKEIENLLTRWYNSLSVQPDYSVYAEDEYIADLWLCWKFCSRVYLQKICRSNSFFDKSIVSLYKDADNIVDLGCGFAYTTASLKQIFSSSNVCGTNIDGTTQMKVAQSMAKDYNFSIFSTAEAINKKNVDLIFASEYFEHFYEPLKHLDYIIETLNPESFLIANGFDTKGIGHIGHFTHYKIQSNILFNEEIVASKETAKRFNNRMRDHGYKNVKTKLWNNRPQYWVKN